MDLIEKFRSKDDPEVFSQQFSPVFVDEDYHNIKITWNFMNLCNPNKPF